MDGTSKQLVILKENGNRKNTFTQNQGKRAEIHWIHNEEGGCGKLKHRGL